MEEQSETAIEKAAVSDCNSSSNLIITTHAAAKAPDSSSSASARKFKGVVLQPNGHWGAQIYANHERIWLGTFNTQVEAAMAYDSAAIKVRSGDSHRNLPRRALTLAEERKFQSHFSIETVLNMIRDGSYLPKFDDYLRMSSASAAKSISTDLCRSKQCLAMAVHGGGSIFCRKLFQKELTPSDVGKLNRLVIPKKFALIYFPPISSTCASEDDESATSGGVDDMELLFFDRTMKSWKFRYCYWKSSQSFVFTRGWNRFVKDKGLKAEDKIIFSLCECNGRHHDIKSLYMIDLEQREELFNHGELTVVPEKHKNTSAAIASSSSSSSSEHEESKSNGSTKNKSMRLFGVNIR